MKIHFIGIGGIGVSALAKYYLSRGDQVLGSDLTPSEITDQLEKIGAKIFIGPHRPRFDLKNFSRSNLKRTPDLVIYSPAITNDNPELKTARKLKIKCQSYPENLGELTKEYFTIAICGTHGKGTTTAMISLILIKAGLDPTVIIGTKLKEFHNSNFRQGKSKYLIIEADEYKSSFLNYSPKIIVLTCLDRDHLDYFKNLGNIIKTFEKFIKKLPENGALILNNDDKNSLKIKSKIKAKAYSLKQKEGIILKKILKLPGDHIISDALAALTLARTLKIKDEISFKALSEYQGAWRRFDQKKIRIKNQIIELINDYAHHPTEIMVTLKAVRQKYPDKKICCVFQPHQYQRTFYLFKDFVKVFIESKIDKLILTDIYSVSGRESAQIKKKVSSKKLAEAIQKILNTKHQIQNTKIIYISTIKETLTYLKKNLRNKEVLIIMGAGDIYTHEHMLVHAQEG